MAKVNVTLKNPPSGANRFGLTLYDWSGAKSLSRTVFSIDGEATFDIPPDWAFPLRFWIQVIYYSSVTVLHQAQSLSPDWSDYIGEFIPESGSYYYNVATKQFELIEPPEVVHSEITIDAPDSAEEGDLVSMSTQVTNISAYGLLFRVKLYAVRDIYAAPAPDEIIGSLEVVIESGQSQVISGTFTMPAWDTIVLIMVYRFIDYWDYDNLATKVVSVEAPVPGYTGSIVRKELKYNGTRKIIPVY